MKSRLVSKSPQNVRLLEQCVRELRALLHEASDILSDLVLNPVAEIARGLCARFHVVQEYFALRYHQARTCAIAAFGYSTAILSFP